MGNFSYSEGGTHARTMQERRRARRRLRRHKKRAEREKEP